MRQDDLREIQCATIKTGGKKSWKDMVFQGRSGGKDKDFQMNVANSVGLIVTSRELLAKRQRPQLQEPNDPAVEKLKELRQMFRSSMTGKLGKTETWQGETRQQNVLKRRKSVILVSRF